MVAQLGRYLILALVFPPYFLAYKGPKWVLVQLQPYLELSAEKIGQLLFLISGLGFDFWDGLGNKMKKPMRLIKKSVKVLKIGSEWIKNQISLHMREIAQPFQVLLHRVHNFTNTFQDKYEKIQRWVKGMPIHMHQRVKNALPELKKAISKRVANLLPRLLLPLKAIHQITLSGIERIVNPTLTFMQVQMSKVVTPIRKTVKSVHKGISHVTALIWHAIQMNLVHPIEKAFKSLLKPIHAIKEVTKTAVQTFIEQMPSATKMISPISHSVFISFQVATKAIHQWTFFGLKAKGERVSRGLKHLVPAFKRVVKTLWDQSKGHGNKAYVQVMKTMRVMGQVAKAAVYGTIDKIKQVPSKLWAFCIQLKTWMVHTYRRWRMVCRIIFAWIKVLVRYSFNQLVS